MKKLILIGLGIITVTAMLAEIITGGQVGLFIDDMVFQYFYK